MAVKAETFTRKTVVVLQIIQDIPYDQPRHKDPGWWEALGLPEPWRWHETFPLAHVSEIGTWEVT